jgi:hypothetical protein
VVVVVTVTNNVSDFARVLRQPSVTLHDCKQVQKSFRGRAESGPDIAAHGLTNPVKNLHKHVVAALL